MNMVRVDNRHPDFRRLTAKLDAELRERYGTRQSAYDQHNVIDAINTAILETGKGQPEVIGLYKTCGYRIIDNYGPYIDLENSICMQKELV